MQTELMHTPQAVATDRIDAFVETFPDARASANGDLAGLDFGVKEIFEQAGRLTPLGLDFLGNRIGTTDAALIRQAEAAGARRVGTTRSTAMAITGETPTRNPRDPRRTPGGSSAGSAAAVAAGLIDFAFGTQTVGSIVRPASYCGVPGLKPTFGALSTEGVMPLSADLDHTGIIARDIDTLARAFCALSRAGHDAPGPAFTHALVPDLWFPQTPHPAAGTAVTIAAELLRKTGLTVSRTTLPTSVTDGEAEVLEGLLCRGIHDNHQAFLGEHSAEAPDDLLGKARAGALITDDGLSQLRETRETMCAEMLRAVSDDTLVLLPSVIDLPPETGNGTGLREPQRLFTLLGWPVISLPVCSYDATHDHLSISVQLGARPGADLALIETARRLEAELRTA